MWDFTIGAATDVVALSSVSPKLGLKEWLNEYRSDCPQVQLQFPTRDEARDEVFPDSVSGQMSSLDSYEFMALFLEEMGLEYMKKANKNGQDGEQYDELSNRIVVLESSFEERLNQAENRNWRNLLQWTWGKHPLEDLADDLKRIMYGTLTYSAISPFRVCQQIELHVLQIPVILEASRISRMLGPKKSEAIKTLEVLKTIRSDLANIGQQSVGWAFVEKWDAISFQWKRIMEGIVLGSESCAGKAPLETLSKEISVFKVESKPDGYIERAKEATKGVIKSTRKSEKNRRDELDVLIGAAAKVCSLR